MTSPLPAAWAPLLDEAIGHASYRALDAGLRAEAASGALIFPPEGERFRALELTRPDQVRVVILGQDPYHGPGQANGLSFAVRPGVRPPPSLANIYRELDRDFGIAPARHGGLDAWARQGVLLLNTVLSVGAGAAGSHRGRGWERLTDAVIGRVAAVGAPAVFMLWGADAQKKQPLIEREGGGRHLILTAPHPSPLSAYRGFIGCGHFSAANAFLAAHGRGTIDWRLPATA